ncbi:MAG: hypothetical protein WCF91_00690 [bacterium]
MKKTISLLKDNTSNTAIVLLLTALASCLLFFKISTLVPAFGPTEFKTATAVLGFSGFFNHIFFLPIELLRSILFGLIPSHGYALTRLPNIIFGLSSMVIFSYLIYTWHGRRTAVLATILFISSAWTLHVSRLASFDVLYTFALLSLVLINVILKKYKTSAKIFLFCGFLAGLIATIPGMIWLLIISVFMLKDEISIAWQNLNKIWYKIAFTALTTYWIPLVTFSIIENGGLLKFIGAPSHFAGYWQTLKLFIAVPVHLFIRGPEYPELWLGRAPVLDVFVLLCVLLGIYFYFQHKEAARSKMLLVLLLSSMILVGLGGAVSLSAPIAIVYLIAATGITFLLKEWLTMFPVNPLARVLGISLISVAVLMSSVYGIRSYFIAWPHNVVTKTIFIYKK